MCDKYVLADETKKAELATERIRHQPNKEYVRKLKEQDKTQAKEDTTFHVALIKM